MTQTHNYTYGINKTQIPKTIILHKKIKNHNFFFGGVNILFAGTTEASTLHQSLHQHVGSLLAQNNSLTKTQILTH